MSEKYRYFKIDVWNPDTDFQVRQYLSEKEDDFFIVGSFVCESDADEYCKRKNENEARKNMPVIYKPYKDLFLITINQKLKWFKEQKVNGLEAGEYFKQEVIDAENTIKAIENLPTEEN